MVLAVKFTSCTKSEGFADLIYPNLLAEGLAEFNQPRPLRSSVNMDFDIPRVKGQPGLVGTRFKAQEVSRMFGFDPQVFPSSPHVSYHHLPLSPWRGGHGGRVEREGSCVLDQLSSRLVAERLAQGSRWKYGRGRIAVTAGNGFEATNAD